MDEGIYRFVPLRFAINESDKNTCKLEKLTNLFPDMKAIIELGRERKLFKTMLKISFFRTIQI